ncbi:MAG: GNAT family N-acetyltransferase [Sphingobacteriales bacterium]|nr:GNAT family N-acetyltransferase [Sphingobacteriales bacterium]
MIEIKPAKISDIPVIHQLAHEIWWPTYKDVLSDEQITFMLDKMYAEDSLKQQFNDGNTFLILYANDTPKGFAAFSETDIDKNYKLQKLYLHPDQQGKGAGKKLIEFVENEVKKRGGEILILNVNRGNKARFFYEKIGYQIIQEIDIPYFQFIMDDYVMSKSLV